MTSRSPSPFWPLGPAVVVLPALAVTGVVAFGTLPMLSWPYQEWVQTSAQFHQQTALAAPIAAATATYLAGRLTPPHRIFALPTAGRVGGAVVARHLALLLGSFVVAYLVGLSPLVVRSVQTAQHGSPAPAVIASGLLGLGAAVTVGYLIGVIGRTAFLVPLTFVLILGVALLGYGGDTYAALTPVLHLDPTLGMREATPLVSYRIAFFSVVIVTGALVCAGVLARHRAHTSIPPPRALGLLLVPVLLMVPPLADPPVLFVPEADPPRVCETHRAVEYCVHAGHRAELDPMATAVGAMLTTYGTATPRAARIWDTALRGSSDADPDALWYTIHPRAPVEQDLVTVAAVLSGFHSCMDRYGVAVAPSAAASTSIEAAQALESWLLHGGRPPQGFPLHGVPVAQVQQWIAEHDGRIATCSVSLPDLSR